MIRAEAIGEAVAVCERFSRRMAQGAESIGGDRRRRREMQAEMADSLADRLRSLAAGERTGTA
jgi:hypothetical protein